jgi:hypothetical protein
VYSVVSSQAEELFIYFCFPLPSSPALALAGTVSGLAYHDAETRPLAGRMFCVRTEVATRDAMLDLTGYIEAHEDALAASLEAAGITAAQAGAAAGGILDFVARPGDSGLIDVPSATANAVVVPLYKEAG